MRSIALFLIFVHLCLQEMKCDDFEDKLVTQSVVYGISSLAKEDSELLCHTELRDFKNATDSKLPWALKVLDASGEKRPSFLLGNGLWLGSRMQCEDVTNKEPFPVSLKNRRKATEFDVPPFPVNYAVARLKHNNSLQFHMHVKSDYKLTIGMCIPASCTREQTKELVEEYFNTDLFVMQDVFDLNLEVQNVKILNEDLSWLWEKAELNILYVFGGTLLIVIIGTIYDTQVISKDIQIDSYSVRRMSNLECNEYKMASREIGLLGKILQCFSMPRNLKAILNTKKNPESVAVLHGLRVFSMLWAIIGHSSAFGADFVDNPAQLFRMSESFVNQVWANPVACVDTFLFISGFLLAYTFCKSKKKYYSHEKKAQILNNFYEFQIMILHRFLRITPGYMYIIGLTILTTTYNFKQSPYLLTELNHEICKETWWKNLIYINNFYPRAESCMSWSWYLGVDMQSFIICSILLFISLRHLIFAMTLMILGILGSFGINVYLAYDRDMKLSIDDLITTVDLLYELPWNRISPYLIGVVAGYFHVIVMQEKLSLSKKTAAICWIIFPMFNVFSVFGVYERYAPREYCAFYMGASRVAWGVGLAWITIACCTNNGGPASALLGHSIWLPASKLTFCAYLLNPLIILGMKAAGDFPFHYTMIEMFKDANSNIMITYGIALLYSSCFEAPFIGLTKLLFQRINRNVDNKTSPDIKNTASLETIETEEYSNNSRF